MQLNKNMLNNHSAILVFKMLYYHSQFLLRFVEAESSLNSKIIESVSAIGNPNITNAVKAAFEIKRGSTIDPFTLPEEMYAIKEDGRSMKTSYSELKNLNSFAFESGLL